MKKKDSLISATYADYKASKKQSNITIMALAIAVVILLIMVIRKDEIIIMVPPSISEDAVIKNGKTNGEYQKRFALPLAIMLGNVSYQNVDFISEELKKMFSPIILQGTEQQLINESRILKARELKQSFVVDDMLYSETQNIVWVWGSKTIKGKGSRPIKEDYTYEFQITAINGFPRVTHYKNYSGHPNSSRIKAKGVELKTRYYTDKQLSLSEGLDVTATKGNK